ncbi:MAG: hypothetical protein M3R70_03955 [Actinomycetota bacterium]|nr:hypothetical protein [Actinomycetota bacterium]
MGGARHSAPPLLTLCLADQLAFRDRLLADGRLHIGSTTIGGERHLRVVVTAPDTDEATLSELVLALRAWRASAPV